VVAQVALVVAVVEVVQEDHRPMIWHEPTKWHWNGYGFRAMNTNVQLWLFSETPKSAKILADVQGLFDCFESYFSRFKPNSELALFNQHDDTVFRASPTFFGAIEAALWLAEHTNGLYDPTILSALEQAGYDCSFEKLATQQHSMIESVVTRLKYHTITMNHPRREIYKPNGLRLDLGGMGKGWTVDRVADKLRGLGPFMINAGGDIYAYQTPPGKSGWMVDLVHPYQPKQAYAKVNLHHQALATSTIARRHWQRDGKCMHHLIDPRTQKPAQTDVVSVSVIAERTVLAEVYAKVALILGSKRGLSYLEQLPHVEGILFTATGDTLFTTDMDNKLTHLEPTGYALGG